MNPLVSVMKLNAGQEGGNTAQNTAGYQNLSHQTEHLRPYIVAFTNSNAVLIEYHWSLHAKM